MVDQDALIKALQENRIGGAGLDVMTPEPLPLDSPLITMDNVGMCNEVFIEMYAMYIRCDHNKWKHLIAMHRLIIFKFYFFG